MFLNILFVIISVVVSYVSFSIGKYAFNRCPSKKLKYAFIAMILIAFAAQFGVYLLFGGRL